MANDQLQRAHALLVLPTRLTKSGRKSECRPGSASPPACITACRAPTKDCERFTRTAAATDSYRSKIFKKKKRRIATGLFQSVPVGEEQCSCGNTGSPVKIISSLSMSSEGVATCRKGLVMMWAGLFPRYVREVEVRRVSR